MIKLLATDLDGTLFYPKRRLTMLTKANKRFLIDFSAAGGKIILVTGRSMILADRMNERLKIQTSLLGCNGAFIWEEGKMLISHPIPREELMKLYITMRSSFGIIGWILFDKTGAIKIAPTNVGRIAGFAATASNVLSLSYREKYVVSEKEVINSIGQSDVYKIMPVFGISKRAAGLAKDAMLALQDAFQDRLSIVYATQALEITAGGVNKARTLKEYLDLKGIKPEEVAVAGDSYNDVVLFDSFSNSFGMESGQDVLKSKAQHLIKTVAEIRPFVLDENGNLLK
jgi:Cof subfamily protein (haloacid dehalogenase superfamily)